MLDQNIKNFFKTKNCLITGGTGMIGREIAKILIKIFAISLPIIPVPPVIKQFLVLKKFLIF